MSRTYRARWLFPGAGRPPLSNGTLTVAAGRVAAVDAAGVRTHDEDLGQVALVPGFVNAHTHLDLTGCRAAPRPNPAEPFPDWLARVVGFRRAQPPEAQARDIEAGLAEALAFGTTTLGDISGDGRSAAILARAPVHAVVFRELLGLPAARAPEAARQAGAWLAGAEAGGRGLSPHAPYSVSRMVIEDAARRGVGLQIHLAESAAEAELLLHRGGPFVPFLQRLSVWEPDSLVPGYSWVVRTTAAAPFTVFAHGNHLDPQLPLAANQSVAYCPRTHAAFGHPEHPFAAMIRHGTRVCLGTDSLASNPDLDPLAEARHVWTRARRVDGPALLHMLTLAGAEALGLAAETGALTPGRWADAVALPVAAGEPGEPHALAFEAPVAGRRTLFRGGWR